MHTSTLRAAGGSIALTIPQSLARVLGLHAGDKVTLDTKKGRLVVAPLSKVTYSLADLLAMQGNEPLAMDREWDIMAPVGREADL
jgi:antitoxin component of MazEF toxin-antitoxin module